MAPPDQAVSLLDCGTRDGESDNVVLRDPRDVIFQRNQQESPLLRLPAELRNKIYGYVVGGCRIRPSWESKTPLCDSMYLSWAYPRSNLSLLGACCQIFAETRLLPFILNTFGGYPEHILDAFASLTVEQAGTIKTMFLYVDAFGTYRDGEIGGGLQGWIITTLGALCSYPIPTTSGVFSGSGASISGVFPSTWSNSLGTASPAWSSGASTSSGLRQLDLIWYDPAREGLCERLRQAMLEKLEEDHKKRVKLTVECWKPDLI